MGLCSAAVQFQSVPGLCEVGQSVCGGPASEGPAPSEWRPLTGGSLPPVAFISPETLFRSLSFPPPPSPLAPPPSTSAPPPLQDPASTLTSADLSPPTAPPIDPCSPAAPCTPVAPCSPDGASTESEEGGCWLDRASVMMAAV